ncbi:MAG: HNH endonuclease [Deltaproteobacteria bacterium]|nr:HNH endonuclease [Deltaproteobacteria bacterium]
MKKLRSYKCQFCSKSILKKDKKLYAEACHIKPKSKGGDESLNNILVLCPNCHKEFDLGDRKEITHDDKKYVVEVNGSRHDIAFEV